MADNDGSIGFSTSIDTAGFNAGLAKIGTSMKSALGVIGKSVLAVGAVAVGAVVGLLGLLRSISDFITRAIGQAFTFVAAMAKGFAGIKNLGQPTKELQTALDGVKRAAADMFSPLLIAAMPAIMTVIKWVTHLMRLIQMIFALLTGQKEIWVAVADEAGSASGAAGSMAKNTKKAGEAAAGALASFDELNVLDMAKEQTTGGGGGGGVKYEPLPITDEAVAIYQQIMDFMQPLIDAFGRLWDAITLVWTAIVTALNPVLEQLGIDSGNLLVSIRDLAIKGLDWLTLKLTELATWIDENPEKFQTLVTILGILLIVVLAAGAAIAVFIGVLTILATVIIGGLIIGAITLISGVITILVDYFTWLVGQWTIGWEVIKGAVLAFWETLKKIFLPIAAWFMDNFITPIAGHLATLWAALVELGTNIYTGFIQPIVGFFQDTLIPMFQRNMDIAKEIFKTFGEIFLANWQGIKAGFETIWNGIVIFFQGVFLSIASLVGMVIDVIEGIVKFLTHVFKGEWSAAWEDLVGVFKTIINGVIDIVEIVVNTVISIINAMIAGVVNGINSVITGLNKIKVDIPNWIPGIGGRSFGINLGYISGYVIPPVKIPRLATGAVIPPNSEFLAMMGDQRVGKNIEAPEDLIRQIVREETGNQPGREISIRFEGSLGALVRELKPYIDQEDKRIGKSLVIRSAA